MNPSRRHALRSAAGLATAMALPTVAFAGKAAPHVVVLGAGFAGTTAAKYLKRFNPELRVTVIEPNERLHCCPMSIRVICGNLGLRDISLPYSAFFAKYDIRWIPAAVDAIDTVNQQVRVGKATIPYDALVVCPGIHFDYAGVPGMQGAEAREQVLHAWRAGPQTVALRDRLRAVRAGGTYGLYIPPGPMRARTGAYERASMVANHFKLRNPSAKVMVFDASAEPPFKGGALQASWKAHYGSTIEYVPNSELVEVDAANQAVRFRQQGRQQLDLLNLIPPQRAPDLLVDAGLTGANRTWCPVDFQTFESLEAKNVYVLGDVVAGVNGTPKSGQMANQAAKVCAAAIAAQTLRRPVNPEPVMISAGYTYVSPRVAFASITVFRYDTAKRAPTPMPGSVLTSAEPSLDNGLYGMSWATNILNDMMG